MAWIQRLRGGRTIRLAWVLLLVLAAVLYVALFPLAEFTSDDGRWTLDAWLRLKEHDCFTPWIATSQGGMNSPLVSLLFAIPLAFWPSVTAVQWLVAGFQIATLALIWRIGSELRLASRGLIAGALFVLSPALLLNYSGKLCNVSLIPFSAALLLWARLCNRGKRRWVAMGVALFIAIQVHYAFVLFVPAIAIDATGVFAKARRLWALRAAVLISLMLLVLACLGVPGLPHLRSLADLLVSGSGYMMHRSLPVAEAGEPTWFVPWQLVPLVACTVWMLFRSRSNARHVLWSYWVGPLVLLPFVALYSGWSPHQWMLPFVVPALLLTELGFEYFRRRLGLKVAVPVLLFVIGEAALTSLYVGSWISESGGTGWHGPSLSTKRSSLEFIAERYPEHEVLLSSPGEVWNGSLDGWSSLASLPEEFLGQVSLGQKGAVVIEERGSEGSAAAFSAMAEKAGWKPVHEIGAVVLWDASGAVKGVWPRVAVIRSRVRR